MFVVIDGFCCFVFVWKLISSIPGGVCFPVLLLFVFLPTNCCSKKDEVVQFLDLSPLILGIHAIFWLLAPLDWHRMSGPDPLHVCAVCGRWRNINPVCGLCRAARAFGSIAFDSRLTEAGVLPILDILDRTVGEVYGLLATQPVPLPPSNSGAAPDLRGEAPVSAVGSAPASAGVAPAVSVLGRAAAKSSAKAPSPGSAGAGGRPASSGSLARGRSPSQDDRPPLPRRFPVAPQAPNRPDPLTPKGPRKKKNKGKKWRERGEERKAARLAREAEAAYQPPTGDTDESESDAP